MPFTHREPIIHMHQGKVGLLLHKKKWKKPAERTRNQSNKIGYKKSIQTLETREIIQNPYAKITEPKGPKV